MVERPGVGQLRPHQRRGEPLHACGLGGRREQRRHDRPPHGDFRLRRIRLTAGRHPGRVAQQGGQLHPSPCASGAAWAAGRCAAMLLKPPYDVDGHARLLGQPHSCVSAARRRSRAIRSPRCSAAIPRRYAATRAPGCAAESARPGWTGARRPRTSAGLRSTPRPPAVAPPAALPGLPRPRRAHSGPARGLTDRQPGPSNPSPPLPPLGLLRSTCPYLSLSVDVSDLSRQGWRPFVHRSEGNARAYDYDSYSRLAGPLTEPDPAGTPSVPQPALRGAPANTSRPPDGARPGAVPRPSSRTSSGPPTGPGARAGTGGSSPSTP